MPRNRYSSAYLFENRRRSILHAAEKDDPGMDSKSRPAHTHAQPATLLQNLDLKPSKTQSRTENSSKESRETQSPSIAVRRKTTTRQSAATASGPDSSQQTPVVPKPADSVDRISSRQSATSKGAEQLLDNASAITISIANDIRQATRNASNISLGRKPPPVAPAGVARSYSRRQPSKDTISILGTALPIDASVNLAYHELLKESNGSDAHPAPETLRSSIVSQQRSRSTSAQGQLERAASELSLPEVEAETVSVHADALPPEVKDTKPSSSESPPKRQPRDRDAMRKELTALLDPCRRKALPPEPVVGIPPVVNRKSSQSSKNASATTPTKIQRRLTGGPSMSSIPEPAEVSPVTSGGASSSSRPRRSQSLKSGVISPASTSPFQKRASFSPTLSPPAFFQPDDKPTTPNLSPQRSRSSLGLLPSMLTTPSSKDKRTYPSQHRHTFSTPSMQDYLSSSSSSSSSSLSRASFDSFHRANGKGKASSNKTRLLESSPNSPNSLYLPHNSSRDLADILPVSAPSPMLGIGPELGQTKTRLYSPAGEGEGPGEEGEASEDEAQPPPIMRIKPGNLGALGVGEYAGEGSRPVEGYSGQGLGRLGGKAGSEKLIGAPSSADVVGNGRRSGSGWLVRMRSKIGIGKGK